MAKIDDFIDGLRAVPEANTPEVARRLQAAAVAIEDWYKRGGIAVNDDTIKAAAGTLALVSMQVEEAEAMGVQVLPIQAIGGLLAEMTYALVKVLDAARDGREIAHLDFDPEVDSE